MDGQLVKGAGRIGGLPGVNYCGDRPAGLGYEGGPGHWRKSWVWFLISFWPPSLALALWSSLCCGDSVGVLVIRGILALSVPRKLSGSSEEAEAVLARLPQCIGRDLFFFLSDRVPIFSVPAEVPR